MELGRFAVDFKWSPFISSTKSQNNIALSSNIHMFTIFKINGESENLITDRQTTGQVKLNNILK